MKEGFEVWVVEEGLVDGVGEGVVDFVMSVG